MNRDSSLPLLVPPPSPPIFNRVVTVGMSRFCRRHHCGRGSSHPRSPFLHRILLPSRSALPLPQVLDPSLRHLCFISFL
uniref:Uncharacterized protein n=1 Tax=Lotus japonicus TaxID=34305 RepID=I3T881_LOTJA|nr:unknown [Lotus japonicus]